MQNEITREEDVVIADMEMLAIDIRNELHECHSFKARAAVVCRAAMIQIILFMVTCSILAMLREGEDLHAHEHLKAIVEKRRYHEIIEGDIAKLRFVAFK